MKAARGHTKGSLGFTLLPVKRGRALAPVGAIRIKLHPWGPSPSLLRSDVRILSIETSTRNGSVALLESGRLCSQLELPSGSAQSLAPSVAAITDRAGWPLASIGLIAVACGPGSFTGLRIGVTTAKTLALALSADLVAVSALRAVAWQAPAGEAVSAVIDAHRGQVFSADFMRRQTEGQLPLQQSPERVEDVDLWQARAARQGLLACGPALHKLAPRLSAVRCGPRSCWSVRASAVGELAWHDYQLGARHDAFALTPQYGRLSAAEEKAQQRDSGRSC